MHSSFYDDFVAYIIASFSVISSGLESIIEAKESILLFMAYWCKIHFQTKGAFSL